MRVLKNHIILALILSSFNHLSYSQELFEISTEGEEFRIGKYVSYLTDPQGEVTIEDIVSGQYPGEFIKSESDVQFMGITREIHWFKLKIRNTANLRNDWLLWLKFEQLGYVDLYETTNGKKELLYKTGFLLPLDDRPIQSPDFAFPLDLSDSEIHEYVVRIESDRTKIVPFFLTTKPHFLRIQYQDNLGYGIYYGIIVGLLVFNLFLFFGLRDRTYIYYIFSVFSNGLLIAMISGDVYEFILYDYPVFSRKMIEVASCLVSISTAIFAKEFLKIKDYSRFLFWALNSCIVVALISLPIIFFGDLIFVQGILYNLLSIQILILLASGFVSWRNGNKYARLFIIAWIGYLLGGMITMGKDTGFLEFSFFTTHAYEFGSALEVMLLAIALSARYNDFRKEKEAAIERSLEIQREATETLEQKVKERTAALNTTLDDLRQTQGQLVLAEKMASLGQLTAGVAHEINNPINFISANIDPLKLNLNELIETLEKNPEYITQDLRYTIDETKQLITVMEDGTRRTSEIVKGLRNFSRMDESDRKNMQINDGIESTLLMVASRINQSNILVTKELGEIPIFEGNPGQLNQVFMNLITNAIDAIDENEKLKNAPKEIKITSKVEDQTILVSISDNGKGIPKEDVEKIFDPFYTTKDVGKGTGLGLSISFGIIERHNGTIDVSSKPGEGTEFVIHIPINNKTEK